MRWSWWLGMVVLFVGALLPRAFESITRSNLWYKRSVTFWHALEQHDWAATYTQYHPGVTTMWIAGAGMRVFAWIENTGITNLRDFRPNGMPAGMVALGLLTAGCIVLITVLLRDVLGARVAALGGAFMAFDPFLLSYSKVLHVDGPLAMFMALSLVAFMRYRQEPSFKHLALVTLFMGLAVLTKSPALVLCPLAALVIAWAHVPSKRARADNRGWWRSWSMRVVGRGAILIVGIVALFFALFPAMWVEPGHVVSEIYDAAARHSSTPHPNPQLYMGDLLKDLGPGYYGLTVLFRTTFVSLPMALIGLAWAFFNRDGERADARRAVWVVLVYALGFGLMMLLASKKTQRYLLPLFPAIDILAAVGLVATLDWAMRFVSPPRRQVAWAVGAVVLVALPASVVLGHHPNYGLHANRLMGGPKGALGVLSLQHQGEGLREAVDYLNALPNARRVKVAVAGPARSIVRRHFRGRVLARKGSMFSVDYRVYYREHIERGLGKYSVPAWKFDQKREPVWTFEDSGITYVWVYERAPNEPRIDVGSQNRDGKKKKKKKKKRKKKKRAKSEEGKERKR
jgi:4-amino-4-deoxy-L-arabinose transferase-like glycosyltransferase